MRDTYLTIFVGCLYSRHTKSNTVSVTKNATETNPKRKASAIVSASCMLSSIIALSSCAILVLVSKKIYSIPCSDVTVSGTENGPKPSVYAATLNVY